MDVQHGWIPDDEFATCLGYLPQVCVDLVVAMDGGVLLTQRTNEPAMGEWFWPGGRVYKGERLDAAARRIAREELGLEAPSVTRLGVSEHFWDESSVTGVEERHTVPIVYRLETEASADDLTLDEQHDDFRILRSREPSLHQYVEAYLDRFGLLQ